jgi:tetratricopeptide (TPR) repeat protein
MLPEGSKKFWTDEFIEYHIDKIAEEAKREMKTSVETSSVQPKIQFGALIKEWANEYGFSLQEAKQQIDQWVAEVREKQEDFYKLGLAAYAEQEFAKAAELFGTYAERHANEYRRLADQAEPHRQKAIQGYRKAGDSLYSHYQFKSALKEFEQALTYIKKEDESELWADVHMDIASANWAIGIRTEGPAVRTHLLRAKQAYAQAEKSYASWGHEEGQAIAKVGLALILKEQGIRTGGEEGPQMLAQAVAAYRAALEVYTREQLPQQWAMTQNYLGTVLNELGIRTGGEEGPQLLAQAVAAYRAALEVRTREQLPQDWAMTQNNLGTVLNDLGIRTGGEERPQLLAQAVAAYRAALEVRRNRWRLSGPKLITIWPKPRWPWGTGSRSS